MYLQANILREHRPAGRGMFAVACHSWRCSSQARKFPPLCSYERQCHFVGNKLPGVWAPAHDKTLNHRRVPEKIRWQVPWSSIDAGTSDVPYCRKAVPSTLSTPGVDVHQSAINIQWTRRPCKAFSLCLVTKLHFSIFPFSIFNHFHFGSSRGSFSSSKTYVYEQVLLFSRLQNTLWSFSTFMSDWYTSK